ncbi:MAG: type III secretion system export apparatus subunit SctS [Geminicoccaceae bacterium]
MDESSILYHATVTLYLVMVLSLPPLGAATLIGLVVGVLQALTQIQDQTLSFALKLIGVILTLVVSAGWLGSQLYGFALQIFTEFPVLTR